MLMCEAEHRLMDYGRSRSEFGLNQENRSDIPFLRVRGVALWSNFGDGKPCERANWSFVCTFSIKTNPLPFWVGGESGDSRPNLVGLA